MRTPDPSALVLLSQEHNADLESTQVPKTVPCVVPSAGWSLVWGTYAGAARRRVHLVTVLLRAPSGHRPGRRQARHARIHQIG